jgi:hypothetical protein
MTATLVALPSKNNSEISVRLSSFMIDSSLLDNTLV